MFTVFDKSLSNIFQDKFEKQTHDSLAVLDRHLTQYDESFRKERERTTGAIQVINGKKLVELNRNQVQDSLFKNILE